MEFLIKKGFGAVFLAALLFVLFMTAQRLTAPPSIDPGSVFNTERAAGRLARILGDQRPHSVDSDANDQVRERLLEEIRSLGFEPVVRDDFQCRTRSFAPCARVRNVLFWVTAPGANAVMIASHYDSVPAGPGASDDGAGVAASLEIASLLKNRPVKRPVLVLITDGEETGLLGATAFVDSDPLAEKVSAVVNMEARGVTGAASLFQTSRPNSRDIAVLRGGGRLPAANSLSADIYRLMPNDTDLTLFLPLGVDAANFAVAYGAQNYHTPNDNLKNLDRRSLFHLGSSALTAAEVFLNQTGDEPETQLIYADILGRWKLTMPQTWGGVLIGLGLLASLVLFFSTRCGAPVRSAAAPFLALIIGLGLAMSASAAAAFIRPETSFGAANPWALRAAQLAAAFLGGGGVYVFLVKPGSQIRLSAAAWFWFAATGAAAFMFVPGSAILFAPALLFFVIAAIVGVLKLTRNARYIALIGALIFTVIIAPLAAFGENALFVENAAPFVLAPLLIFILVAPVLLPAEGLDWRARLAFVSVAGIAFIVSTALTLIVPAYSETAPRHLSIVHVAESGSDQAYWSLGSGEAAPEPMMDVAPFAFEKIDALPGKRYVAPAPAFAGNEIEAEVVSDTLAEDERTVQISISAPDADIIWAPLEKGSGIRSIETNGQTIDVAANDVRSFSCSGRSCRRLEMKMTLDASQPAPTLSFFSLKYGLGPESQPLVKARPDWAVPMQNGDFRMTMARLPLADAEESPAD